MSCHFINCAENISNILLEISVFVLAWQPDEISTQTIRGVVVRWFLSPQVLSWHVNVPHYINTNSEESLMSQHQRTRRVWTVFSLASHHTCFTFHWKQCFWALMENRCLAAGQDYGLCLINEHCYCKAWYLWRCICWFCSNLHVLQGSSQQCHKNPFWFHKEPIS